MKLGIRLVFLLIFLGCAGALAYALYLQLVRHLLPCPLCVVQRIAYWVVGLTALLAFLHNPRATGRRLYSCLIAVFASAGAIVALRHAWLLRYPEAFECGISPEEKFLNALSIAQWWPSMFEANGDCADSMWEFMSLTIPDWSTILFVAFGSLAGYAYLAKRNRR